jgi:hypothetical protein
MRILKSIVPALILVIAFSCGKESKKDAATTVSDADGNWVSTCEADSSSGSTKSTFVVGAGAMTLTTSNYSDAACATATNLSVMSGVFTVGSAVSSPAGAKEVNSSVTKITVTISDDNTLAYYNGTMGTPAVCGGGFVKNVAKELNSTSCKNDTLYGSFFADSFSIYKVDGAKLYQGECGESGSATDCSAATKRPTSLETTFYTKS